MNPTAFSVSLPSRRAGWLFAFAAAWLALSQFASAVTLSAQEQQILQDMMGPGQNRPFLVVDPVLTQCARNKAADMAARHYFDHTTPDGVGPNFLVRQAGYKLPDSWTLDPQANYIESIAAGYPDAADTWNDWMNSPEHKTHLLATNPFFANQTSIGIGFVADPNSDYTYYWVVITAPPQAIATLTIASPANGAQVTDSTINVSGTTGTAVPAARVAYRVENSGGIGAYQTLTGVTSWSGQVTGLIPGPNVVRFASFDASGKMLLQIPRSVLYMVPADLTVNTAGTGTVTAAFAGTTARDVGFTYTVVAVPGPGMIFSGWSGSSTSMSRALTFVMAPGYQVTANFIPNPFPAVQGGYYGLISDGLTGHVAVALTSSGLFTIGVRFEGRPYTLRGQFDATGHASLTVPRTGLSPLSIDLQLDLKGGGISGSITDGTTTANITSSRAYDSVASGPYPKAGRYTIVLPPDPSSTDTTLPQGNGFAILTIYSTGAAVLSGSLPDGQTFLFGSRMTYQDNFYILAQPAASTWLNGSLTITSTDVSDLQGTLRWIRGANPAATVHPALLDTVLPLVGSAYVAPAAGAPVLNVPLSTNNTEIVLAEGNLTSSVTQPTTLNSANQVLVSQPVLPVVTARVNATVGAFVGSFVHPVSKKVSIFRGVIFQKQNSGFGYFVGPSASGYTSFQPAP